MEQVSREDFAEFVLNMRKSLGVNRTDFSRISGISTHTLARWEKQLIYPRKVDEKIKKIRDSVKVELKRRRGQVA